MSKVIIVTAPSGAGKTTLVRGLIQALPQLLSFSVSATTRPRRAHEAEGRDYYFLTNQQFEAHILNGDFLEWEEVYAGRRYGTLVSEIQRIHNLGKHALFDVDVKGALALKARFDKSSLAIFVRPPTKAHLRQRLVSRGTESPEEIEIRMARADFELALATQFDVVLINDRLPKAQTDLQNLVMDFIGYQ